MITHEMNINILMTMLKGTPVKPNVCNNPANAGILLSASKSTSNEIISISIAPIMVNAQKNSNTISNILYRPVG